MTTEDVRVRLLATCDAAYERAFAQSARGVRAGILKARQVVSELDPDHDVWRWFEQLLAELERLRARVNDAHDDDGFELGGIATVRNAVEELRSRMGYISEADAAAAIDDADA